MSILYLESLQHEEWNKRVAVLGRLRFTGVDSLAPPSCLCGPHPVFYFFNSTLISSYSNLEYATHFYYPASVAVHRICTFPPVYFTEIFLTCIYFVAYIIVQLSWVWKGINIKCHLFTLLTNDVWIVSKLWLFQLLTWKTTDKLFSTVFVPVLFHLKCMNVLLNHIAIATFDICSVLS